MLILVSPEALCNELSPAQSDKLFFPGTGGKVKKARDYCNRCPLKRECLIEAIEYGYAGFISGTTEDERRVMAKRYHLKLKPLVINIPAKVPLLEVEVIDEDLSVAFDPPTPKLKKVRRKRRILTVRIA